MDFYKLQRNCTKAIETAILTAKKINLEIDADSLTLEMIKEYGLTEKYIRKQIELILRLNGGIIKDNVISFEK